MAMLPMKTYNRYCISAESGIDAVLGTIGSALEGKEYFNGDKKLPPPVFMGNGWLIPDWLTLEEFAKPEVKDYLTRIGFLRKKD